MQEKTALPDPTTHAVVASDDSIHRPFSSSHSAEVRRVLTPDLDAQTPEPGGYLTGLDILLVALAFRWTIVATALIFGISSFLLQVFASRQFAVSSSFMPQSHNTQSSVSGLAAQIGLAVPSSGTEQSPAFYADLLGSETILRALAYSRIETNPGHFGPLVDSATVGSPAGLATERRAIDRLRRAVSTSVTTKTGVIRLAVTDTSLTAAYAMNRRLLDLVNEFNVESRRQTQATAERTFFEERVKQTGRELRGAEDNLQGFLSANRQSGKPPGLSAEEDRLRREVMRQEALFGSISEAYERARLDAIRNTPSIVIVEPPSLLVGQLPRLSLPRVILALLVGGFLGLCWAFAFTYFRTMRTRRPDAVGAIGLELRQFFRELRHPLRAIRARKRR